MHRFEIVYADGEIVAGSSQRQWRDAPDDGIQFVIIEYEDGHVVRYKALDEYEYHGVLKPGSLTDTANYEKLKFTSAKKSRLMNSVTNKTRKKQ